MGQLGPVGYERGLINATGLNFMLSVVKGIEARDQVEAALAAQMAAVQMATMTFACQLAHLDNIAQQDSAERAFNTLAQIFCRANRSLEVITRDRARFDTAKSREIRSPA
jgi:hypothetical protein